MEILIAPVQGHTDAAYRHYHSELYKGNFTYYTPFIRLEKNELRNKDIKDSFSHLNENINLVPQIIFKDEIELKRLIQLLKEKGIKIIDLNMGCPFPLQTGHGRGSATINNQTLAQEIVNNVIENPDIQFSVKMRLGMEDNQEWRKIIPFLNQIPLNHITLHPRIAKQQYGGEPDLEQFKSFLSESKNPVIYNGDIKKPEDFDIIIDKFPNIKGVMVGRGLLGRPSLATEFITKRIWVKEERKERMLDFHRTLFQHYSDVLCGDSQIISKIQPFWEYSEEEIGRKAWKAIKKASNIAKYQSAVALI